MSESAQLLLASAAALPIDERLELVHAIWDTIAAEPQDDVTPAQRAELLRRLALHHANPNDVIPWEEVEAKALQRSKPEDGSISDGLDQAAIDRAGEVELLRRLEDIKSGKAVGKPGEQVFAEIRGRNIAPKNGSRTPE